VVKSGSGWGGKAGYILIAPFDYIFNLEGGLS
jgi:hypothetical protein